MFKIRRLYFLFRNWFARHFPKVYCLCDQHKKLVKCFFAGAVAGGVDLFLLFIFIDIVNWPLVLSTSLAFFFAFLVSFNLQKFWTFRNFSQGKVPAQLVLYLTNAFIGLNINGFLMHLFVNEYEVWYLLAQLLVNFIIGFYNFFAYNFVIFKIGKNENRDQQKTLGTDAGDLA